jgi:hypothetical protein
MDITTVAKSLLELLAGGNVSLSDDLTEVEQIVRDAAMRIGARAVELRLEEERRRTRSVPKHQAIRQLVAYLTNQGRRIAYDRFRAADCDIGSGRVESACKHVVANRMKRSGMIWSNDGAQEMLSLRTACLNGQWNQIWEEKPLLKKAA